MKKVIGKAAVAASLAARVVERAASRRDQLARFGSAFEAYRLSRNIRQEDLADQAGIARSTLARLERDGTATLDTTLRVLDALGLADRMMLLIPEVKESPLDLLSGSRQRATGEGAFVLTAGGYLIRNKALPRANPAADPEDKPAKNAVKKHVRKPAPKTNLAQAAAQLKAARAMTMLGKRPPNGGKLPPKGGKLPPKLEGYRPKWGDER